MRLKNSLSGTGRNGLTIGTVLLPLAMFLVLILLTPRFLTVFNLANVNSQIAALFIVSLGQMFVAISRGIDLSVGAVMSVTSAILVTVDPCIAVPLAVFAGFTSGLVNGIGVAVFGVHPLVMTLASMTFLQGFALLIHPAPGGTVPETLVWLASVRIGGVPAALAWCLVSGLAMGWLLTQTRFGLRVFAIGGNPDSAARNGISVSRYRIASHVLCALLAVVAGIYLSGRVSAGDPTMGTPYALDSVAAIALGGVQLAGGVGGVIGVLMGSIVLGLLTNGMNLLGVSPFLRMAATGVLLLLAISVQRRTVIGV
jgi:ribose transport system permease protein